MAQAVLLLDLSGLAFADVTTLGPGRSVILVGGSPTLALAIEVTDDSTGTSQVIVGTIGGTSGEFILPPTEAAQYMRARVTAGSFGTAKVWVSGPTNGSIQIDLTTSFQDVSAIGLGRMVYVRGGSGISIAVDVAESAVATEFREIGRIPVPGSIGIRRFLTLPSDSNSFVRYRVAQGSSSPVSVWIAGGPASAGGGAVDRTSQLAWYIDAVSGNDALDGKTAATALKTLARWFELSCDNGTFSFNTLGVVVHQLTSLLSTDSPQGTLRTDDLGSIKFVGTATTAHTSTGAGVVITPIAPNAAGGGDPWKINDPGVADFTPYLAGGAITRFRIRWTGGAASGAIAYVMSVPGANQATLAAPITVDPTLGPFGQSSASPGSGDPYVIEQLPTAPDWGIKFIAATGASLETVVVQDIAHSLVASSTVRIQNDDIGVGTQIGFYGCTFAITAVEGGDFLGCVFADGSAAVTRGPSYYFGGGCTGSFFNEGLAAFDFDWMLQGGSLFSEQIAIVGRLQGFEAPAGNIGAIVGQAHGVIQFQPFFAGTKRAMGSSTVANAFWVVQAAALVVYNVDTSGMTGLGSGGAAQAIQIGEPAAAKAYTDLPFPFPNSFAGMIVQS